MASVRKRLGATTVTANTDTSLYIAPANTETIVSTILVCNRGATTATYRVAHVDGDISAIASEDYIVYDATVPANDSVPLTIGITMQATHSLIVRSSSTSVSFIAWGTETTASANPSDIGRTIVGGRLERASDSYLEWQPYINGSIGIYNGSAWSLVTPSSNPSLVNSATDLDNNALTYDYNYDIFAEWVSTSSFYLRAKKWSGDTTRGFALYRHDGVLVLDNTSNGVKRRFLGTVRLRNDSGAKFTDQKNKRFVSNYYNSVLRSLGVDNPYSSDTHENATTSWRSWNGDGDDWKIEAVCDGLMAVVLMAGTQPGPGGSAAISISIGMDAKTPHTSSSSAEIGYTATGWPVSTFDTEPSAGYHYWYPIFMGTSSVPVYYYYSATGRLIKAAFHGTIWV
jgi:hypothetical protein